MKNFYLAYKEFPKLQQLAGEIPRGQNMLIIDKCKTIEQRAFYINLVRGRGLSRNVLIHHIEANAFGIAQQKPMHNFEETIHEHSDLAEKILKDEYIFDFLGINEPFAERKLEASLLDNIKKFLMELGDDFCFIANQYKLTLD